MDQGDEHMINWTDHAGLSRLPLATGTVTVYHQGGSWYYNVGGCSFGPHVDQKSAKEAALLDMQRRVSLDAATILTMRIGTP